ncbi:glycoside hydrolase family 5 protein [Glaciecola sp. MH2013]|uniref:glycoside hydrolase family 5 protein n=1 Tax=Glaciecola sp. MH2013 TaxID=2785524 RepID=UPI00189FCE27|nr:glycoside hydrolase family 5 protein [Glaciecola sp. MH2013]MBF7074153.1 glycoside hydrolase family 5 protein [Glaciecola sp. MH2013]
MKNTALVLLLAIGLVGCGSGGSSSTPEPAPVSPPAPPPPPAPPSTPEADALPNMFSFGTYSNALPGQIVESGAIVISGMDDASPISISGGEFSIDGGTFQSEAATIDAGQGVTLRAAASTASLGEVIVSLSVGDLSVDYPIITADLSGRVEAESASLLGDASMTASDSSSSGQVVNMTKLNDGIAISAVRASKLITLSYTSNEDTSLSLLVEGSEIGSVDLYATGQYKQSIEFFYDFAADTAVQVVLNSATEATSVSLDYVDFVTDFTAEIAAQEMGAGFNLGQMFESNQHEPSLANAAPKIDAYYKSGYRNVRIPITWTETIQGNTLVEDTDTGVVDRDHPRLLEIMKVVDYALAKPGMYVVINMHHESTLKAEDKYQVLEQIWADNADIFADRSHRLIFEILNEPHQGPNNDPMEPEKVRRMSELAYNKIRAKNSRRIIIIGGNQWFGAHEMAITWPNLDQVGSGQDAYLMATFHHYDPWEFNGASDKTFAWNAQTITTPMQTMESWSTSVGNNMPIYIGEWGNSWGQYLRADGCNNIKSWYNDFNSAHASNRPITAPTAVWDDGGWFQIWNHSTNDWGSELFQCITGNCMPANFERNNSACSDTL